MGNSASVSKVSENSAKAAEAINKLRDTVAAQESEFTKRFEKEILDSMNKSGIKDQLLLTQNKEIQTEYASEFNISKIKDIVTLALKAAATTAKEKGSNLILSDDVINSYVDLVGAVCDSAKTNSSSTASYSFLMNRLVPGLFIFISNSTVSLKDEKFFGSETAITTTYYYKTMLSIDDIKRADRFNTALIKAKTLNILKETQVANAEKLAGGSLTFEDWEKNEDRSSKAIARIQKELDDIGFDNVPTVLYLSPQPFSMESHPPTAYANQLEFKARALFENPNTHKKVVELFKGRYENGYFL